jgi:hypothetical protein
MIAAAVCMLAGSSSESANLLLNSSFRLAANGATPDFWDLHHAAALRFRNLHDQYNLTTDRGPVSGARVLRIINSESDFPYLYLLSRQRHSELSAGDYMFSVYARADRPGNLMGLVPTLDRMDQRVDRTVGTEWRRYSAEFHIDASDKLDLSPLLVLPSHGTYWISAPQLEPGDRATPYAPSADDRGLGVRTAAQRRDAEEVRADIARAVAVSPATGLSAVFEFNSYTAEPIARLQIRAASDAAFDGSVACGAFSAPVVLSRGQTTVVDVPISAVPPGVHECSLSAVGQSAAAKFTRISRGAITVRVNRFRHTLELNGSGFQIRGIMVGGYVPPEWYFADIADHGINTLIVSPRVDERGTPNTAELDAVIRLADRHGLKLIVGPAVMGPKNSLWRPFLDRYAELVAKYRDSPAIIGWFVVDEPQAWTLQKNDLVAIHDAIGSADPRRLVFVNWGSDDVPTEVGVQPHGTLAATDLYSIDYYPFANDRTSLEIYTLRTIRALRTGALAGQPGHSWLQLYGYLDVTREPTGDELGYLAYVNLLYGGNYSYWQTKSNAGPTWDRVRRINEEIAALTNLLSLNPDASELGEPVLRGRYLYSAWKTPKGFYLIVLHVADATEPFAIDLKTLLGSEVSTARTYFENAAVDVSGSTLKDSFSRYATRVYEIN